jgi:hypothetical protein
MKTIIRNHWLLICITSVPTTGLILAAILYVTKQDQKVSDWLVALFTMATAIGEFLIVWAIISEVKGARHSAFLEKMFEHPYKPRADIYTQFVDNIPASTNPPDRATLWKAGVTLLDRIHGDEQFRANCGDQVAHLNQVAVLFGSRTANDALIEYFPHTVTITWIMLIPYILERKADQGHYWAAPLDRFALDCLDFILQDPEAHLSIFSNTHAPGEKRRSIIINNDSLKEVRRDLTSLTKCKSLKDLRAVNDQLKNLYGN